MNPSLITRSAISTVSESTQKTKVTERMHAIEGIVIFVWFVALRASQQLWSCRVGQFI